MREHAQQMQGIGMVRIGLENLPVKPLRFIQPSGSRRCPMAAVKSC